MKPTLWLIQRDYQNKGHWTRSGDYPGIYTFLEADAIVRANYDLRMVAAVEKTQEASGPTTKGCLLHDLLHAAHDRAIRAGSADEFATYTLAYERLRGLSTRLYERKAA